MLSSQGIWGMSVTNMKLVITTLDDAKHALSHFHSFHDSVIKAINMISHDTVKSDGSVLYGGVIDIALELLLCDLDRPDSLHGKVIRATFMKATDVIIDFRGFKSTDWGISHIDIVSNSSSLFDLSVSWDRCEEEKGWGVLTSQLFTFESAVFEWEENGGSGVRSKAPMKIGGE